MSQLINQPSENLVQLCPACSSLAVTERSVVGDTSECTSCGHSGPRKSFPAMHVRTSGDVNEAYLFQQMANTLIHVIAPEALARWLSDWGFIWWVGAPKDNEEQAFRVKVMGRYAMAIGKSALRAILEERVKLEKDRVEHERRYS